VIDGDTGLDSCHGGLDECRGLAGSRAGEHQQRTAAVINYSPLRGVEHRRCRNGTRRRHQVVDGLGHRVI
jgi:hypothetical protein